MTREQFDLAAKVPAGAILLPIFIIPQRPGTHPGHNGRGEQG